MRFWYGNKGDFSWPNPPSSSSSDVSFMVDSWNDPSENDPTSWYSFSHSVPSNMLWTGTSTYSNTDTQNFYMIQSGYTGGDNHADLSFLQDYVHLKTTQVTSAKQIDWSFEKPLSFPAGWQLNNVTLLLDYYHPKGVNLYQCGASGSKQTLISSTQNEWIMSDYSIPLATSLIQQAGNKVSLEISSPSDYGDINSYSQYDVGDLGIFINSIKVEITISKSSQSPVNSRIDTSKTNPLTLYDSQILLYNPSKLVL